MKKTLESLNLFCKKHNYNVIGIYPNTDPGSYEILDEIEKYNNIEHFKFLRICHT